MSTHQDTRLVRGFGLTRTCDTSGPKYDLLPRRDAFSTDWYYSASEFPDTRGDCGVDFVASKKHRLRRQVRIRRRVRIRICDNDSVLKDTSDDSYLNGREVSSTAAATSTSTTTTPTAAETTTTTQRSKGLRGRIGFVESEFLSRVSLGHLDADVLDFVFAYERQRLHKNCWLAEELPKRLKHREAVTGTGWQCEWHVATEPSQCDSEGWQYARTSHGPWRRSRMTQSHQLRQRAWCRLRFRSPVATTTAAATTTTAATTAATTTVAVRTRKDTISSVGTAETALHDRRIFIHGPVEDTALKRAYIKHVLVTTMIPQVNAQLALRQFASLQLTLARSRVLAAFAQDEALRTVVRDLCHRAREVACHLFVGQSLHSCSLQLQQASEFCDAAALLSDQSALGQHESHAAVHAVCRAISMQLWRDYDRRCGRGSAVSPVPLGREMRRWAFFHRIWNEQLPQLLLVVPAQWKLPWYVAREFCSITASHLATELECAQSDPKKRINVDVLVEVAKEVRQFEQEAGQLCQQADAESDATETDGFDREIVHVFDSVLAPYFATRARALLQPCLTEVQHSMRQARVALYSHSVCDEPHDLSSHVSCEARAHRSAIELRALGKTLRTCLTEVVTTCGRSGSVIDGVKSCVRQVLHVLIVHVRDTVDTRVSVALDGTTVTARAKPPVLQLLTVAHVCQALQALQLVRHIAAGLPCGIDDDSSVSGQCQSTMDKMRTRIVSLLEAHVRACMTLIPTSVTAAFDGVDEALRLLYRPGDSLRFVFDTDVSTESTGSFGALVQHVISVTATTLQQHMVETLHAGISFDTAIARTRMLRDSLIAIVPEDTRHETLQQLVSATMRAVLEQLRQRRHQQKNRLHEAGYGSNTSGSTGSFSSLSARSTKLLAAAHLQRVDFDHDAADSDTSSDEDDLYEMSSFYG
ncbi:MAG: hypothetical protein MHM6MM_003214 [Cercozoa sp. M6MM]